MKHHQSPFGIVPVEVAMDQRLTLQQMRVLLALYTFRNRNTELTHPTREAISERTGMELYDTRVLQEAASKRGLAADLLATFELSELEKYYTDDQIAEHPERKA